mgnify:FL=1
MSVVLCIVFVACAVCGCSGAASQKFPQKFSFQYGGKEITIGDNIDKAVEYLGEPEFTTDPAEYDCVRWGYDGVTIKQLDSTIISISISDLILLRNKIKLLPVTVCHLDNSFGTKDCSISICLRQCF